VNYLLDTNIVSEVRKGSRCNANVARWYRQVAEETLYLSVLVLGEIRKGIERNRVRDASQARALEKWLANLSKGFSDHILAVDQAVADEWGHMSAIRPVPVIDGLLAATAKVHGMTLVTRNTLDVANLGVGLLNPFNNR
jgi:predicted nucleic acid-binding protein